MDSGTGAQTSSGSNQTDIMLGRVCRVPDEVVTQVECLCVWLHNASLLIQSHSTLGKNTAVEEFFHSLHHFK